MTLFRNARTLRVAAAGAFVAVLVSFAVAAPSTRPAAGGDKKPVPEKFTYLGAEGLPPQLAQQIKDNLVPLVGKPMPALSLGEGHNGGASLTAEDLKGKVVIVDVWATWCPPCIAAIPKNNKVYEKYKDQGVVVLGVTTSNGQENLDKVMAKNPIKYPVAKDPEQKTLEAWKAMFFPTYYAVDRDGIVRGVALSPEHLEDVVKMLLEEQPAGGTA